MQQGVKVTIPYQGKYIQGTLYNASSKTVVIISAGYLITQQTPLWREVLSSLIDKDYAVFLFDPYSWTHKRIHELLFPDLEKLTKELQTVIHFFATNYTYNKTVLVGMSLGAYASSMLAMRHEHIDALITFNGFINFLAYYSKYSFIQFLYALPPLTNLYRRNKTFTTQFRPELITIPTLVLHGEKDTLLDPQTSVEFYNKISTKNKQLILLPNIKHLPRKRDDILPILECINQWIQKL